MQHGILQFRIVNLHDPIIVIRLRLRPLEAGYLPTYDSSYMKYYHAAVAPHEALDLRQVINIIKPRGHQTGTKGEKSHVIARRSHTTRTGQKRYSWFRVPTCCAHSLAYITCNVDGPVWGFPRVCGILEYEKETGR